MYLIYASSQRELSSIKQWLSLTHKEDYLLLYDVDDFINEMLIDSYDIIIFDYYLNVELIDNLRLMDSSYNSIEVFASTMEIGRAYCVLTDNVHILPKAVNLMLYLWEHPAFSLDNIESANEVGEEVFSISDFATIDTEKDVLEFHTTVRDLGSYDLAQLELLKLDKASLSVQNLSEEEEFIVTEESGEEQINATEEFQDGSILVEETINLNLDEFDNQVLRGLLKRHKLKDMLPEAVETAEEIADNIIIEESIVNEENKVNEIIETESSITSEESTDTTSMFDDIINVLNVDNVITEDNPDSSIPLEEQESSIPSEQSEEQDSLEQSEEQVSSEQSEEQVSSEQSEEQESSISSEQSEEQDSSTPSSETESLEPEQSIELEPEQSIELEPEQSIEPEPESPKIIYEEFDESHKDLYDEVIIEEKQITEESHINVEYDTDMVDFIKDSAKEIDNTIHSSTLFDNGQSFNIKDEELISIEKEKPDIQEKPIEKPDINNKTKREIKILKGVKNESTTAPEEPRYVGIKTVEKNTPYENSQTKTGVLAKLRRRNVRTYKTSYDYFMDKDYNKEAITEVYEYVSSENRKGDNLLLEEELYTRNIIDDNGYIIFMKEYLHRQALTLSELMEKDIAFDEFDENTCRNLRILQIMTGTDEIRVVVGHKSRSLINTLLSKYEKINLFFTLDKYIDYRIDYRIGE